MKLIIDIPEDVYKRINFYKDLKGLNDYVNAVKAIDKGIPLERVIEDIKAEIDKKIIRNYGSMVECGMRMALETIDKHIKGDSE